MSQGNHILYTNFSIALEFKNLAMHTQIKKKGVSHAEFVKHSKPVIQYL